jgi:hypothetical protein
VVGAALCFVGWVGAQANTSPLLLAIKLQQNEESLAECALMLEPGIPATLELDQKLRLEVKALADNDAADMQFRFLILRDGAFVPIASPRLLSYLGKEVSVEFTTDRGEMLKLLATANFGDRHRGTVREQAASR